ncbi:MAG TPA: iron ABC transporter substrate-binding protein, partial [Xanthobacteraceae bacterium]|nr:iron ABC transporter substrate-binding protein [Xanthobacteraceae bacterium]
MSKIRFSRRDVFRASAAIGALVSPAVTSVRPVRAQARAPAAEPITPALVEAARKEGKLAFYTAMDLPIAEKFAKTFEAKFPGIAVRVERSGAERVFQRIGQEMESRIYAVDVVNSADGAHFIVWTRNNWLAPYLP